MSGHASPALTLTLFGGFAARAGTGDLLTVRTSKERALVAYLALESETRHGRSKLATLLWGNSGEGRSRDSLRHALGDLRRGLSSLPSNPLAFSRDGVRLDLTNVEVDVVQFQQLIGTGSSAALEAAVGLYRGDLLEGIVIDEEAFERWLAQRRETLHARLLHALEKDLERQLEARRAELAIEAAQRILRIDRTHENAHRALMRLYDEQGQRASALRQYRSCAAALQTELGTAPDRQTRALHDAILRTEHGRESTHLPSCSDAPRDIAVNAQAKASSTQEPFDVGLVGRDEEIALLRAAIDAAALGSGGCVFLVGEAGVGKTRLACEAMLGTDDRALLLHARAYQSERGHVLGVWADALRSVQGGVCEIRVAQLDPVWARELVRLVPELVPGEREPVTQANERWLFEAVLRFVCGLAAGRAAVIIIDDLHWADDASVRLLAFVARRIASSPVLIVATVREEEVDMAGIQGTVDALTSGSCARIIEVKPLRQACTLELFDRIAARRKPGGGTAQARARIWELSRGSPFMIVEAGRAMREGMDLNAFAAGNVPESIRRVVGTRVRQVPEGARAVLAIAAVINCEFDFALIARVAGLAAPELVSALEQLVRRRMLQVTDERLGFTHAWIREWVYESLLPARRQLLHLEVAKAYEATTASGLESLPATLVHHYSQAKAWPEAAANARRAGECALRRGAYAEAAALFGTARFALEQLPRDARVAHDIVDLLVKLHRALVPTGSATSTLHNLDEAEALSAQANDPQQHAAVLLCRSECARWTGDYVGAIERAERGLSAAFESGDTLLVAEARFHLGLAHFWKGHYRAAISTLRQSALAAREKGDAHRSGDMFYAVISARQFLVLALASIGRFASARKVADEATAIAATLDEPFRQVGAARALGLMLVEKGEFDTAIPWLERTLARCEREHLEMLYALIAGTLGYAYALTGRAGEGIAMIRQAIVRREALRGTHTAGYGAYLDSRLAEACIIDGRIDAAVAYVEAVTDLAHRFDNRVDQAWSLRLSGDLAVHDGRRGVEEGVRLYLRSRAVAARLGMAPFAAHCDRRIARLAAFGLDEKRSGAALERARIGYARLGMSHWLTATEQMACDRR